MHIYLRRRVCQIIPPTIKKKPTYCLTLIISLRKKTDPSKDTTAVNGKKDEATETGIFFMEAYQHRATIAELKAE